ncbi:hypothetical protein RI367_001323 [Sorochytrium milnesiophthora]
MRQHLATADLDTQRTWWAYVIARNWQDGANMLFDLSVPYLPILCDYQDGGVFRHWYYRPRMAHWVRSPRMAELLQQRNMVLVERVRGEVDTESWLAENLVSTFILARRLPVEAEKRLPVLRALWDGVKTPIRSRMLRVLVQHGDMATLQQLGWPQDDPLTPADIIGGMLDFGTPLTVTHSADALEVLRDHCNVKLDLLALTRYAIERWDTRAFTWLFAQLTRNEVDILSPATLSFQNRSLDILEWLQVNHKVLCDDGCPEPDYNGWNSDDEDGTGPVELYLQIDDSPEYLPWDAKTMDFLNRHHPHAINKHIFSKAAMGGQPDFFQWLHDHRPDLQCPPEAVLELLRLTRTDVLPLIEQLYPDAVAGIRNVDCDQSVLLAYAWGYVHSLNWYLERHPAALECLTRRDVEWSRPVKSWCWMLQHPQYAVWRGTHETEHQYCNRRLADTEEEQWAHCLDDTGELFRRLQPTRDSMPDTFRYFGASAIATRNPVRLMLVMQAYQATGDQVLEFDALYKEDNLLCLCTLPELGVALSADLVGRCLRQNNTPGATWLLESGKIVPDNKTAVQCARYGRLGLLQRIHRAHDVCRQCILDTAQQYGQSHILEWCAKQHDNSWRLCARHSTC